MGGHVLIVGGGIAGLCAAYYASSRGMSVTVVERGGPYDEGCSHANAGMVVPSHVVPLAAPGMLGEALRCMLSPESPFSLRPRPSLDLVRWGLRFWRASDARHVDRAAPVLRDFHLASRACFEELAERFDFGLVRRGLLMLCKTGRGLEEEVRRAEYAQRLGVPARVLNGAEAQALEPGVRLEVEGAVHYPLDCHLTPSRFLAALRGELERASARLLWNTRVTGWRASNGRIDAVTTTRGELAADEYVLAAGVWSTTIARGLGLRLPIQAGKGYAITLAEPRRRLTVCAILSEARVAVTPMGGSLRIAGTMELGADDTRVSPARVRGIVKAVPRYLPDFTIADLRDLPARAGLRPCSPDGLPYVGRTRRFRNLLVATGHSMMGVSLGPITGRVLADLLTGSPPLVDVTALSPDRFAA